MISRYWRVEIDRPDLDPLRLEPARASTCGCGPYSASTVLARKIDAPMVAMITGRNVRFRSG